MRKASDAEREARYRELVAQADDAFSTKDYAVARSRYNGALDIKPEEKYPKDRLAAIDAAIAKEGADREAAERMAAEQRRLEEERLRREAEAAEAARLAEMSSRQREEEERRRREAEEAEARRLDEERARMEREGAKALEERYRTAIVDADEALATKDLQRARSLYAQASDIKPAETYPKSKMDQIDRLLEEQERQRLEAELAAQQARERREERPRTNTTIDMRKEQEAEQFMREAREREEAEKYERIKKLRAELEREEQGLADAAGQRRTENVERKQQLQEGGASLYAGDEARRRQNAEEVDAYRDALARAERARVERSGQVRDQNYDAKLRTQEQVADRDRTWVDRHADRTQAVAQRTESIRAEEGARAAAGLERNERNRQELEALSQRTLSAEERGRQLVEEKRRAVEEEKRAQQLREQRMVMISAEQRGQAMERIAATPPDQPRSFNDFNRSKLAQDYPPGVTEESYTEGNKVIIRRVVVQGNRADEYSKVIAKWGTFYFKNGQSITEAIWARETEG